MSNFLTREESVAIVNEKLKTLRDKPGVLIIPLTLGYSCAIDEQDLVFVNQWKWHASTKKISYTEVAFARRNRKRNEDTPESVIYLHRELGKLMGLDPKKKIGHKDGFSLDNTRANICQIDESVLIARTGAGTRRKKASLSASRSQKVCVGGGEQVFSVTAKKDPRTCGERFISITKEGLWAVKIKSSEDRQTYRVGSFPSLEEAIYMRDAALTSDLSVYPVINKSLSSFL